MSLTEDVEMTEVKNLTPQSAINSSVSMDSGYLSLSPRSAASAASRTSAKRPYWLRERKSSRLYTSDCRDSMIDESNESEIHDYPDSVTLRRRRRSPRVSAAVTPAARRLHLSPPPSPALASTSFVASEPGDGLVQSTPHFSPRSSRVAERQLSLRINEYLSAADVRPKRLDFDHFQRRDLSGREAVDFMSLLAEKGSYYNITEKILSFLSPQDLCSVSMVSHCWRRTCLADFNANFRRLEHVGVRQNTKENLKLIRMKAKMEEDAAASSPRSPRQRFPKKGCLLSVQNHLVSSARRRPPGSPPVSPSKAKFHSFLKLGRNLAPCERLFQCPKCQFACSVDLQSNVGKCTRMGCSTEFCTSCSSTPHAGPCRTPLLATPTKRKTYARVCSKQSKRNLRRL